MLFFIPSFSFNENLLVIQLNTTLCFLLVFLDLFLRISIKGGNQAKITVMLTVMKFLQFRIICFISIWLYIRFPSLQNFPFSFHLNKTVVAQVKKDYHGINLFSILQTLKSLQHVLSVVKHQGTPAHHSVFSPMLWHCSNWTPQILCYGAPRLFPWSIALVFFIMLQAKKNQLSS